MLEEDKVDPNAYMQLAYEQNSEMDDVQRLQDDRIAVINAEVSAVQDMETDNPPDSRRAVETLDRTNGNG